MMSDLTNRIWDMKYRLKAADGTPVDATPAQSLARVAWAAAQAERPARRAHWAGRFAEALANHRFLPAGRILAGAGTGRQVTLFNCFVMGRIDDDMGAIFSHLREAALTMQQGGGIGYDFSTLRPKGAPVRGVGADASGPVSFMEVWDAMCRTIMSAGSRRGAMMATLACNHPDIEDFIAAKREPGRLAMFNLSVLVSDAFLEAVKADREWPLEFAGRVYKTLRARELWDRIMRATYDYAEPGVIFIDRINALNNLAYCESIHATNPCLTADSWIHTSDGPRQIGELSGVPFKAVANGAVWPCDGRGFFSRGTKPVYRLTTREGYQLRLTADHRLRKVTARNPWSVSWQWQAAGSLSPGDEILLQDHRNCPQWGDGDEEDHAEGYLIGLLHGDGDCAADSLGLSVCAQRQRMPATTSIPAVPQLLLAAQAAARTLDGGIGSHALRFDAQRGRWHLGIAGFEEFARKHDLMLPTRTISAALERRSQRFYCGFLRGLFDASAHLETALRQGPRLSLWDETPEKLRAVQRMLLRLGVVASLSSRRDGIRRMPAAFGYELALTGANLARFAASIGLSARDSALKLKAALAQPAVSLSVEPFTATVAQLEAQGEEAVFDAAIPGLNAFDANGFWAHNCGEQPLPAYGACLLGSINLAQLVNNPFSDDARLDVAELAALTRTAVRFLDNVIDISRFPLPAQQAEAAAKRRIGLGITGLADALIFCRLTYGEDESLTQIAHWLQVMRDAAYDASAELAAEKGAFALFDREAMLSRPTIAALPEAIRDKIARRGLRNGLLTSIAPTGTISLFAGNVSSGIEPVFAYSYTRKVLLADGTRSEEVVSDYAYRLFRSRFGEDAVLPDYFVNAQNLAPEAHLQVQAVAQRYIDSSISKTINVPENIDFAAFKDIYLRAYALGCKGCTTYRPNAVTGSVLSVSSPPVSTDVAGTLLPSVLATREDAQGAVVYMTRPLDRPELLAGQTYKIRWQDSDHAFYITINDILQDHRRRPFEIFINSKNMEAYAWTLALTRMISAVFRRGGDVSFVVDELKAVFDPRGGQWSQGRYVPSLLAAIGDVIERHLVDIGFMAARRHADDAVDATAVAIAAEGAPARFCPRCSSPGFIRLEGCDSCLACGYSRCG